MDTVKYPPNFLVLHSDMVLQEPKMGGVWEFAC
jgi:hypothetical protein